ncbi:RNA polymerase sigma-70 factor [Sphingobacterium phlebotomi]|uniref:RNA polymerase sigma-70 factor n=1 Tax=Sphingobacterium phlebotomi TaxID=2605433 RepID=A0A5D4HA82_9SPHI|nr:RNA polymerase sigma-70 factor [Sphingobacterium phlebotomi]TYR37547.1 RNA polymerase sigma-70 factor [Sphingobacterium phlebotomi]
MSLRYRHSEQELIELLRMGDEKAFKELYRCYWDILLDGAFKRLGSIEQAEEIVQDIFVSLYVRRGDLHIATSIEAYLKNALKFKVFDVFRRQITREKYIDNALKNLHHDTITPEEALQIKELKEKIDNVTKEIPEKCREVFLLSRVENLPHKKIAELLGISVSTVEKHISKATRILRTNFKEYHLEVVVLLAYLYQH